VPEAAAYHLHEGIDIQSQGHDYEYEVGIVHLVGNEPCAVIEADSVGANDVDKRYAPYPTQLEEVACGEHEDNGKDIDHKIEVDDAFLVLTNVYEYLAWIFVKAVYSIPMA
jgi:hypothetical protein